MSRPKTDEDSDYLKRSTTD